MLLAQFGGLPYLNRENMNISLRPETLDDEPFIRALIVDSLSSELQAWSWPDSLRHQLMNVQYAARRQSIRAAFPESKSQMIVRGDKAIGWTVVAESPLEIRLVEIVVHRAERGKGAGTSVISGLLSQAELSPKPVRLSVHRVNINAIHFYERMGFSKTGGDEIRNQMEWVPA